MKLMKDYHDLCLKCDVLLPADDMFQKFRKNSLKNYVFCPSQYLIAAALSWVAMLNMTKVALELIPDPEMYIFFEVDTRGIVNPRDIVNIVDIVDIVNPTISI